MKQKRISFCQGKGSLTHNNRDFIANNVDTSRTKYNITFVKQNIADAYNYLFAESTQRYNSKQKRSDRKIDGSYYESVFGCKPCGVVKTSAGKRKSFYEDIVQIGKLEDSAVGTPDGNLVAECLKEYIKEFQTRNPNLYVFNAVLHMDEATPHLHLNYIPIGHYKRGQDIQNGMAQALKEMGFGEGKNAIARWRASEVEVLKEICKDYGIIPIEPQKSRGTLTISEYKEQKLKTIELAEYNTQVEIEIAEKERKRDEILKYQPDYETTERLEFKFNDMCEQLNSYLRNPISATRNKKEIEKLTSTMRKTLMDSYKARNKSEDLVYQVEILNNKIANERDKIAERAKNLTVKNRSLLNDNKELRLKLDQYEAMILLLKNNYPLIFNEIKKMQEISQQIHRKAEKSIKRNSNTLE